MPGAVHRLGRTTVAATRRRGGLAAPAPRVGPLRRLPQVSKACLASEPAPDALTSDPGSLGRRLVSVVPKKNGDLGDESNMARKSSLKRLPPLRGTSQANSRVAENLVADSGPPRLVD